MGEPDDYQSLIRFLLEANEFNILGLIATDRNPELNQQSLDRIHEVIDAYEKVYPDLIKHASGYPTAGYLRSVATVGSSVVAACDAINHYYGRPQIPVGLSVDPLDHPGDEGVRYYGSGAWREAFAPTG